MIYKLLAVVLKVRNDQIAIPKQTIANKPLSIPFTKITSNRQKVRPYEFSDDQNTGKIRVLPCCFN